VPAPQAGPPAIPAPTLIDTFFQTDAAMWASFDLATLAGKAQLMQALEGDSELLDKHIGTVIEVADIVLQTREVVDEGEVRLALRGVLVTAEGTCIGTWSGGAMRCLRTIMAPQMWGRPPWRPPLRLRVVQKALQNGMRTYKLIPEAVIVDSPEPEPKKGGKRG